MNAQTYDLIHRARIALAQLQGDHPLLAKLDEALDPVEAPEPSGPRGCHKLSIKGAARHNTRVAKTLAEGKLYRLYDHHRSAFWGPDSQGYKYRKDAGVYSAQQVREIILGDAEDDDLPERFFSVEEVIVVTALPCGEAQA